jgi:uncharacterized protein (DUF58 family)
MADRASLAPSTTATPAGPAGRWPGAFGRRFFIALILGLVFIGPAWWDWRWLSVMAAWDASIFALWASDYRRLPSAPAIYVTRRWNDPPSLGVSSHIVLEIAQNGPAPLRFQLLDDVPRTLRPELPQLEVQVPAHGSSRATYEIRPTSRGDARLNRVYLRYQTSWQFAERWAVADLAQDVRIYPSLVEARRQTLYLIRSRQIEMERRLKHQTSQGREFESLRDYRDGDELRSICWTASARCGRLVSKLYRAERSQGVMLVLDAGRLMLARVQAGPETRIKLDYAVNAALSLAQVALYSGDSIGLLAYGRRIQARLPPARGTAHLRCLLDCLSIVRGELAEADHARAADFLFSTAKRRMLVVWLTDLAETVATPEVIEAASRLMLRHVVLFAAVGQPLLHDLVRFKPESVEEMYRYVVAQELVARRAALLAELAAKGAVTAELAPNALAAGVVNRYLEIKERGRL